MLELVRLEIRRALFERNQAEERAKEGNPSGLLAVDRMSQSGKCVRKRWADVRGIPIDHGCSLRPETLAIFRLGHVIEKEVVELLTLAGYEVTDTQRVVGVDRWIGHIDGIIRIGGRLLLLEIKSAKAKKFEELEQIGDYSRWNSAYAAQIQAYLGALPDEISGALVVVYNKDNSELYTEYVAENRFAFEDLKAESRIVTESPTVPDRPKKASRTGRTPPLYCGYCERFGCDPTSTGTAPKHSTGSATDTHRASRRRPQACQAAAGDGG